MRSRLLASSAVLLVVALMHQEAQSDSDGSPQPAEVLELLKCRGVADATERLGCFERTAEELHKAVQARDLIVVRKTTVDAARRARFGLPDNGKDVLGGEAAEEIKATIRSASATVEGWVVALDDGSTWQQVDATASNIDPRAGMAVTIKRGALGSYRLVLNPHAAFKVRRVR